MKATADTRAFVTKHASEVLRQELRSKLAPILDDLRKRFAGFLKPMSSESSQLSAESLLALAVLNFPDTSNHQQQIADMDVPEIADQATTALVELIQTRLPVDEIVAVDSLGDSELENVLVNLIGPGGPDDGFDIDLSVFYQ